MDKFNFDTSRNSDLYKIKDFKLQMKIILGTIGTMSVLFIPLLTIEWGLKTTAVVAGITIPSVTAIGIAVDTGFINLSSVLKSKKEKEKNIFKNLVSEKKKYSFSNKGISVLFNKEVKKKYKEDKANLKVAKNAYKKERRIAEKPIEL